MDIQKSTVRAPRLIRYEVTLTYRVVVEAPSDEDAVIDARYIVEDNAYDEGPPDPDITVRAADHSDVQP